MEDVTMVDPISSKLELTAARRRFTGEPHRLLLAMMQAGEDIRTVPDASTEQADLEAEVFLQVCKAGGFSPHPAGIINVRPRSAMQLAIRLVSEPYIVRHWAERLLPQHYPDIAPDPVDQFNGVPGVRYQTTSGAVRLYRPGHDAEIRLTGFPTRWWNRMATAVGQTELAAEADWTSLERSVHTSRCLYDSDDTRLASPLLRRIRVTVGSGTVNATEAWTSGHSLRVETTDGPPCEQLVDGLRTSPGWQLERGCCNCGSASRVGCGLDFRVPRTGQVVDYSNLRWQRTVDQRCRDRIAEMNGQAFA
ncbi:hypothetical protein [Kitasatospora sp. NPDC001547]|uniref:hypothetical protein n=1 Tax=Kitasatospora sp. NPDC001547 TaxID=3364015 RepID=UPI0036B72BBC